MAEKKKKETSKKKPAKKPAGRLERARKAVKEIASRKGKAGKKPEIKKEEVKAVAEKIEVQIEKKELKKPLVKQPKIVKGKKPYHWVEYKPAEIEQLVVTLANAGQTPSEIGMALRDQHGIPSIKKVTGMTVEGVLAKNNLLGDIPRDLLNLIRKSVNLQKHMKTHRKDFSSKRGYQVTLSKIRRLVKYYQKAGKLPAEWRYTEETAALLVK